jgi:hypothetical protein
MVIYVCFDTCITTCIFDLSMPKGAHDIFVVVVNFLFHKCEAKHVIIKLFEVNDISGEAMIPRLQLLDICPLLIRSLLTSRMRGQICQCFEFGCFVCKFGYLWAIWWIMLWTCPIKGLPICDYGWENGPWIVLHIHKDCSNWYPKM